MPPFGPVNRRKLVRALKNAGFKGPFAGGHHEMMQRGDVTIRIPSPHRGDTARNLLAEILRQAGITREQWEKL